MNKASRPRFNEWNVARVACFYIEIFPLIRWLQRLGLWVEKHQGVQVIFERLLMSRERMSLN